LQHFSLDALVGCVFYAPTSPLLQLALRPFCDDEVFVAGVRTRKIAPLLLAY